VRLGSLVETSQQPRRQEFFCELLDQPTSIRRDASVAPLFAGTDRQQSANGGRGKDKRLLG
jgi:hypothetical protein